mmetsp:Transcript_698/g.1667  ORF Transcript_698/g.1667 Transcript_698/m.1667 type:complete len:209 (+) Transcript_698:34-660(+)
MPLVPGDGAKGKDAIYGWEKQARDEQAEMKAFLDREWSERHHRKRVQKMGEKLREAGKCGDVQTIRALLDSGVYVDATDGEYNQTALHYAAREGRRDAVDTLLVAGANPNARNADYRTPMHWAAANGTASVVRLLAAAGADLESRNADGETPLDVANYWNNGEAAPALRQLLGYERRVGVKCEGFENKVQNHFSVQRVGVFPNTKAWR